MRQAGLLKKPCSRFSALASELPIQSQSQYKSMDASDAGAYGFTPFSNWTADGLPEVDSNDGEELNQRFEAVALVLGERHDKGQGVLFLTTRLL